MHGFRIRFVLASRECLGKTPSFPIPLNSLCSIGIRFFLKVLMEFNSNQSAPVILLVDIFLINALMLLSDYSGFSYSHFILSFKFW